MQNLAVISDENEVEVQLRATAQELCSAAGEVVIFTRADVSHATDLVKAIKDRAKQIEEERTRLVKPFNEGVKQINGRFKAMLAPLQDAETEVKGKILSFQREEEKKAREEQQRLEQERLKREQEERKRLEAEEDARKAEMEEGEEYDRPAMPVAPAPVAAPVASSFRPTTYGQTGAVSTVKKQWASELVDITQVPAEYLLLDQVKVNQAIRAGLRDIPGLRIFEKEILQVR